MKKNQQGIAPIGLAIVIMLVAIVIGFAYYAVKQPHATTEQSSSAPDQTKEQSPDSDPEATSNDMSIEGTCDETGRFISERWKFSIECPTGWNYDHWPDDLDAFVFTVSSTDAKYCEECMFGGLQSGFVVSVHAEDLATFKASDSYNSIDSIADGTYESKMSYTNPRSLTVDGYEALEYLAGYEGPPSLITRVDTANMSYTISFGAHYEDGFSETDIASYNKFVSSFKIAE